VKVKPLYNVVVANLTGAMIFGIMNKVGAETLHQKHGLHPIQVRGMGLTLQHNMMLSAAPAALVA